ncbi:MauE/DoxX family redox-associated membrane protein [Pedobacter insulae]|uniref:Methylamine utilisation protein MauE domain-containing protein n=1 Tax=Pedobacter insulae TaxID=414048 RepID=A0A1I2ZJG6_9SPHI|nr:MauE/DoxX family redox-associated membrane protein [Pedobacter insulae]SFH37726.1 hypothetical protein SAMN04489864_11060 [Pedobacter insulae]
MNPTVVKIISYSLVLLFIYAAANKLLDYQKFTVQIGQSPILIGYAGFIAWFIPAIEIVIVLLLFHPKTLLIGLYASYGLMAMFTGYIVVILNFAERVPCSCGGILDKMGWHEHLIFNITFTILPVIGIFLQTHRNKKKYEAYSHTIFFGQGTGVAENL